MVVLRKQASEALPGPFSGVRLGVTAVAVYCLCVVAPLLYEYSPSMRDLHRQVAMSETLHRQALTVTRMYQAHVLNEALSIDSPIQRGDFLRQAKEQAYQELEGYAQRLQTTKGQFDRCDTRFNRLIGNNVRKLMQQQLAQVQDQAALAQEHLARLQNIDREPISDAATPRPDYTMN